jgi:hypothetical protein
MAAAVGRPIRDAAALRFVPQDPDRVRANQEKQR